MIYCEFVMPWAANQGKSGGGSATHRQFKQRISKEFGGVTVFDARGDWYFEGNLQSEMVTVYRVAVNNRVNVLELKDIALQFARAMDQKALFFSVIGKAEILNVEAGDNAQSGKNQSG